jgi:simple sugar transport system permease protein
MYYRGVPPAIAPVPKAIVIVAVCLIQSEELRTRLRTVFGRKGGAT